jgi:hypothetical protein
MRSIVIALAIVSKLVSGCGDGASPSGIPALPEAQPTGVVDEKANKDKKSDSTVSPEDKDSPVAVARAATAEQPAAAPDGLATLPRATVSESAVPAGDLGSGSGALKLTDPSCQDAAVSEVKAGVRFMKCDGSWAEGTMTAETVTVQVPVPGPTVTLTPTPIPNCTSNRQVGCVTTSTYESANLASIGPANIRQNIVIAGVTGTMVEGVESHTDCNGNKQVGCITTATFKSADFTNIVPGKLKAGSWVAGVMGEYPSATYPIKDSTATSDLDLSSFNTKLESTAAFEWFDSAGTRYSNNGSASFTAVNVMAGVTVFGVTGTMSPGEQPNAWDIRYGVAINGITGVAKMSCRSDTTDVALKCDTAGWDTHADIEGHVAKTDRISGLMWVSMAGNAGTTKASANTFCTNLANSTGEAWRVPALEEINSAFVHRIDYVFSLYNVPGNRIWSSSSYQAAGKTEASVLLDSVSTSATTFCVKYRASY